MVTAQARLSLPETNVPNNLAVDGARDTVLQLKVHLGDGVVGEDRSVRDITWFVSKDVQFERAKRARPNRSAQRAKRGLKARTKRTNSSRLDHVADGESLDGLVLGRAARAVAAADGLDVAAALLVAAAGRC